MVILEKAVLLSSNPFAHAIATPAWTCPWQPPAFMHSDSHAQHRAKANRKCPWPPNADQRTVTVIPPRSTLVLFLMLVLVVFMMFMSVILISLVLMGLSLNNRDL